MIKSNNKIVSKVFPLILSLTMVMSCFAFLTGTAGAKSITKAKPKISKSSAYKYNKIALKWTKIKGAKKYQIERARINPKKGKIGKWKKWKTVKKNILKKKASGDFKYRVRAVKGNKKSKWSKARRVFAAYAKITKKKYEPLRWYVFGETLEFKVSITNKTKSPMGFIKTEAYTFYVVNKKTGKVLKKSEMDVNIPYGGHKQINPGKSKALKFTVKNISEDEYNKWESNKNIEYMLTFSFYPNPRKEPIKNQMAISCTKNLKDSTIACK